MRPPFRFPEDLITLQKAWQQTYADSRRPPPEPVQPCCGVG
ncbi:hypothetical protein [Streptomyces sp. NPDC056491]